MVDDARFEDADEAPLRLAALDAEDLKIIAALTQDSVFPASEMMWDARARRFALLLNRFRWEESVRHAGGRKHPYERVQSVLAVDDVMKVSSQGIDPKDKDVILSLLDIIFEPGEDGTGRVILTLAGDGAIALEVEALNVILKDVTRPYVAPSKMAPHHEV